MDATFNYNNAVRFAAGSILLLVLVSIGCVSSSGQAVPDLESMSMEEQISHYKTLLKSAPESERMKLRIALIKKEFTLSMAYMGNGKAFLDTNDLTAAIQAFEKSLQVYPANQRASQLLAEAKNRRKSHVITTNAEALLRENDLDKVETLCREALKLDPRNNKAAAMISNIAKYRPSPSMFGLTLDYGKNVSFRFKNTPIADVFDIISSMTDVNFLFDKDISKTNVTLFVKDVALAHFLDIMLKTNNLAAKQAGERTILIYPGTSQKLNEYMDLEIRTFYLSAVKAKEAGEFLKSLLKLKEIVINETANSITVRSDGTTLDIISKLISVNDVQDYEVLLNVEFMAVSTKFQDEVGLSFSDSITFGVSETSAGISYDSGFSLAPFGSFHDMGNLTSREIYTSIPTVTLNLLREDSDTKVLAKPTIRAANHEEASILIGRRIPLRSNRTVESDGRTTYDFSYQDVGVKLVVTPDINTEESIRMVLKLEVSALGENVGTVDDPQYAIDTRSAYTTLSVTNGNTVIIGGLIQQENRESHEKLPLLSSLPFLGRLFSSDGDENDSTDLLMTIQPVIIKTRPSPSESETRIWSEDLSRSSTLSDSRSQDRRGKSRSIKLDAK